MSEPSRIDLLELDIDTRMSDLWAELGTFEQPLALEQIAAFMRAAFGRGYCEALLESNPGSLCRDHGYRIPARRAA